MEAKISNWIRNNLNSIFIPLYIKAYTYNKEKIIEYILEYWKKQGINENLINQVINNNIEYINNYVQKKYT